MVVAVGDGVDIHDRGKTGVQKAAIDIAAGDEACVAAHVDTHRTHRVGTSSRMRPPAPTGHLCCCRLVVEGVVRTDITIESFFDGDTEVAHSVVLKQSLIE